MLRYHPLVLLYVHFQLPSYNVTVIELSRVLSTSFIREWNDPYHQRNCDKARRS